MKLFQTAILAFMIAGISACASSPNRAPSADPKQASNPEQHKTKDNTPAALRQPGRLLAMAREIQAKKGCAKAIPNYRVISSFGDGYDIAQYELGACLLQLESTNTTEIALFHEEAVFWLRRAAFAGNARAQLKLAEILSGEKSTIVQVPTNATRAMGWAILYNDNPARSLYGLPPVSDFVTAHLQSTLTANDTKIAETFANDFEVIKMESFTPPKIKGNKQRRQQLGQGRPDGKRKRR